MLKILGNFKFHVCYKTEIHLRDQRRKNFLLKKKKLDEMSMSYIYLVKNIAIQKIHIQNAHLNSLYTEKLIKYNKNWFFSPQKYKIKIFKKDGYAIRCPTCSQTCQVWSSGFNACTLHKHTHMHIPLLHTQLLRGTGYTRSLLANQIVHMFRMKLC